MGYVGTRYAFPTYFNFLNVLDYGAVGDGVTDDMAAIQAGIDAAVTAGKTLYFPANTYLVAGTLNIPSNAQLRGAGATSRLLKVETGTAVDIMNIHARSGVRISDLAFVGEAGDTTMNGGINVESTHDSILERLTFTGLMFGLFFYQQTPLSYNMTVTDIVSTDCRIGMFIAGLHDSAFARIDIEGWLSSGNLDHCMYISQDTYDLTFQTLNLKHGQGVCLQFESGNDTTTTRYTFNDVTLDATGNLWGGALYIATNFSYITMTDVHMIVPGTDYPCVKFGSAHFLSIDGFTAVGGYQFADTYGSTPSDIAFANGTYDGTTLPETIENVTRLTYTNVTVI